MWTLPPKPASIPMHKSLLRPWEWAATAHPPRQASTASSEQTSIKELQTIFNKVILIGRLGKNAEVKSAQNKKDHAVFSITTSKSWKNDKGEYERDFRARSL